MRFSCTTALLTLLVASAAVAPLVAHADTITFSYTGDGVSASGTFTVGAPSGGVYTVTAITGTRNGQAITGLEAAGAYQGNDNTVALGPPYFTLSGLSYDVGGIAYNIFVDSAVYTPINGTGECSNCGNDFVPIEFSDALVAPVPEPSSLMLFGTGILGFAGAARRRFSRS